MVKKYFIYAFYLSLVVSLNAQGTYKTEKEKIQLVIKSIEKAIRAENHIVLNELFKEDNDLKDLPYEERGNLLINNFCKSFKITTAAGNTKSLLDRLQIKIMEVKENMIVLRISLFGYNLQSAEFEIDFERSSSERYSFNYKQFKNMVDDLGGQIR